MDRKNINDLLAFLAVVLFEPTLEVELLSMLAIRMNCDVP